MVLVGIMRGLADAASDFFHRDPIPPDGILEIWQPGDPHYDALHDVPRQ